MTIVEYLRSLHVDPEDPNTPFLIASEGLMDTYTEDLVTSADYGGNPYAIVLTVANTDLGARTIGGVRDQFSTVDILLEQRPNEQTQLAADRTRIKKLYSHISANLPDHVKLLDNGIPLSSRLQNVGGLGKPETRTDRKDWLLGGVSYRADYLTA